MGPGHSQNNRRDWGNSNNSGKPSDNNLRLNPDTSVDEIVTGLFLGNKIAAKDPAFVKKSGNYCGSFALQRKRPKFF